MNIILFLVQYFGFLTLIPLLARNFGSAQGVCLLFLMNNRLFPILAQSFSRAQGLGFLFFTNNDLFPFLARNFGSSARLLSLATPESYSCTSRISQRQVTKQLTKITAKMKTKLKQTHSKPIFWRSNFNFSPKTRIFDKFRTTFLCKTKPICKPLNTTRWSIRHHFNKKMQNEPNLNIFLTWLTKTMKRTYTDFYQKDVKKTNPILTFS
jgi:hypothetical protein